MKKIVLMIISSIYMLFASCDRQVSSQNTLDNVRSSAITLRGPEIMLIGYAQWCVNRALDNYNPDKSMIESFKKNTHFPQMIKTFNFPASVCNINPLNVNELVGFALASMMIDKDYPLDEESALNVSNFDGIDTYDLYNLNKVFFKKIFVLFSFRLPLEMLEF